MLIKSFIQLFVEPIEGVSIVHTQQLLTKMFPEHNVSFVKVNDQT